MVSLNLPCSEDLGVEMFADALLGLGEQVAIAVEGGLDGSMTELRLDEFGVGPLGNEERSVGVSQIVEPDLPEACPGEGRFKLSSNEIAVLQRCSLRRTKNEIMRTCRTLKPMDLQCLL